MSATNAVGYFTSAWFEVFTPFRATLRKAFGPQTVTRSIAERFVQRIDIPTVVVETTCWEWRGATMFSAAEGAIIGAARMAWILAHRSDPPLGARIRPACGNALCVRPEHLEARVRTAPGSRIIAPPPPPIDFSATIEDLAPPELRRLASAQFGDTVSEPPRARIRPVPVQLPPLVVRSRPGVRDRIEDERAAQRQPEPHAAPDASATVLAEFTQLLARPGTALVTYASGDTTLICPTGTYRDSDVLALMARALVDAGRHKEAA